MHRAHSQLSTSVQLHVFFILASARPPEDVTLRGSALGRCCLNLSMQVILRGHERHNFFNPDHSAVPDLEALRRLPRLSPLGPALAPSSLGWQAPQVVRLLFPALLHARRLPKQVQERLSQCVQVFAQPAENKQAAPPLKGSRAIMNNTVVLGGVNRSKSRGLAPRLRTRGERKRALQSDFEDGSISGNPQKIISLRKI
jgi:hypothetical protein